MPRAFFRLTLCFVIATGFGQASSPHLVLSQTRPPTAHDFPRLREWLLAVERHEPGAVDAAAVVVGAWRPDALEVLFADVRAILQVVAAPEGAARLQRLSGFSTEQWEALKFLALQGPPGRANRLRKRGAMLHADIAMLVPASGDVALDTPEADGRRRPNPLQRTSVVLADGRQRGVKYAGMHWDFARTLLDKVTPDPSSDGTVRLWYQSTGAWQIREHQFSEAVPHLERARAMFPADARIFLVSGGLYEILASARIQEFIRTTALPRGVVIDVASERANLRRASAFYRRAVDLDPDLTEARVRLGRVLGLQKRHEDAVRELQRVDAAGSGPLLQYYTALFLGAAEEALGQFDRARDALEAASALYPRAQSPYLALSRLAWRTGDRPGALRVIQPVLTLGPNEDGRTDPWWIYFDGTGRDADPLLDRLRRLFQHGGEP